MVSSQLLLKGQPSMPVLTRVYSGGLLDGTYEIHQLYRTTYIGCGIYNPNTHHDLSTRSSLSTMRKPNAHLRHQHSSMKILDR